MDFDMAAARLKRDQQSSLARSRASQKARSATAKARREAQAARAKAERRMKERRLETERDRMTAEGVTRMLGRVERELGAVDVGFGAARVVDASYSSSSPSPPPPPPAKTAAAAASASASAEGSPTFEKSPLARGWTLEATSIHGQGDKIALPPSILEAMMTSKGGDLDPWGGGRNGRPIAFRIGIPNPSYGAFPTSPKMRALVEAVRREVIASENNESALLERGASAVTDDDDDNDYSNDVSAEPPNEDAEGSHDDDDDARVMEAYLDELSCRYLSYTHGTVVEFTQEDGRVGLPEPVARALLRSNSRPPSAGRKDIPVRRTVDPASAAVAAADDGSDDDNGCDGSNSKGARDATPDAMEVDVPAAHDDGAAGGDAADGGGERTPGHPAYNLFDIPALPIEVVPINSLPPGKNCIFAPTASSVRNGFYALKDVKLVLEQSLMRTRATLTRGDVIRTWRRGASYDLVVSGLTSARGGYGAVSCVNTDLNVDIGPPEEGEDGGGTGSVRYAAAAGGEDAAEPAANATGGGGRMLSEPTTTVMGLAGSSAPPNGAHDPSNAPKLPPEPAEGVKQGVCSVQIRCRTPSGGSAAGRRRFNIAVATMADLFAFASSVCEGVDPASFCLVTRFPRRVFWVLSPLSPSPSNGEQGGHFAADATLESAGIAQGQEMFMLEII